MNSQVQYRQIVFILLNDIVLAYIVVGRDRMLHGGADDEIGVWLVLLIGNNDDLLIN